ncbi:hypothetical protein [Kineosporia babensis]|uniref:Uncharacterized protein n=1 Tax=Kineosporia babensis TaxID=499548 RepID=A0A9X1T4Z3_9ACTN|nr:hypothetical protein [Kineosporia babensis]MCD5317158.1 hypothetical protein [Kineosporia babensis]
MKITKSQASAAIVTGLSVYAFANSYMHGVHYATQHGAGAWAWGTAAIPELLLISALLRDQRDARFWIGVVAPVLWTFWVNAAAALDGGVQGLLVGLIAPAAAVLTAWMSGHGSKPKKAPARKAPKKVGVVEGGIAWAKRQKTLPDVAKIQAARNCSLASARKIYQGTLAAQTA